MTKYQKIKLKINKYKINTNLKKINRSHLKFKI